jgi:ribose-phosphate pyrophosphokinase
VVLLANVRIFTTKYSVSKYVFNFYMIYDRLRVAGVDHVLTLDLHSDIIPGFFQVPVDNLLAEPSIAKYITQRFGESMSNLSIISKNAGGAKR